MTQLRFDSVPEATSLSEMSMMERFAMNLLVVVPVPRFDREARRALIAQRAAVLALAEHRIREAEAGSVFDMEDDCDA